MQEGENWVADRLARDSEVLLALVGRRQHLLPDLDAAIEGLTEQLLVVEEQINKFAHEDDEPSSRPDLLGDRIQVPLGEGRDIRQNHALALLDILCIEGVHGPQCEFKRGNLVAANDRRWRQSGPDETGFAQKRVG